MNRSKRIEKLFILWRWMNIAKGNIWTQFDIDVKIYNRANMIRCKLTKNRNRK